MRIALLVACLGLAGVTASAQTNAPANTQTKPEYTDVFYRSGSLRIEAYLYKPDGDGPFPVVIYNHGSREGHERDSVPFKYAGSMLTRAGYVVLVPERRGYGKSDGAMWRDETQKDPARLVPRLQEEVDDVLAAIGYLRTLPFADTKRMGIMGWSFGGIVTMLATSRSSAFLAAVDQAGGSLSWDANAFVRSALIAAAGKSKTPTLFQVAKNDRTTVSVTSLAAIFEKRGQPNRLVIYDAFTAPVAGHADAPGHLIFSMYGAGIWESDVVQFLNRYLMGKGSDPKWKHR
ncbi:MAG TPA: alpha/beta fold hydrolase [Thermoanaerobaculia bacterium]|nr:alpha/beta fold hydrolase [Thermoanaerobaculia bacterium]